MENPPNCDSQSAPVCWPHTPVGMANSMLPWPRPQGSRTCGSAWQENPLAGTRDLRLGLVQIHRKAEKAWTSKELPRCHQRGWRLPRPLSRFVLSFVQYKPGCCGSGRSVFISALLGTNPRGGEGRRLGQREKPNGGADAARPSGPTGCARRRALRTHPALGQKGPVTGRGLSLERGCDIGRAALSA